MKLIDLPFRLLNWRYSRLMELRDYLITLPDEQFDYRVVFRDEEGHEAFELGKDYHCGTVGCAAGHACMLFDLHRGHQGPLYTAANHLRLTFAELDFLFIRRCSSANKQDAINRMDWLINFGRISTYNWEEESWNSKTQSVSSTMQTH